MSEVWLVLLVSSEYVLPCRFHEEHEGIEDLVNGWNCQEEVGNLFVHVYDESVGR